MSDNDNPLPGRVVVSATAPDNEDDSRAIPVPDEDSKYCASLRRVHKIDARGKKEKVAKKQKSIKKKDQPAKKNPIRIFTRPLPGRSFDGFLDRFVKSNILDLINS